MNSRSAQDPARGAPRSRLARALAALIVGALLSPAAARAQTGTLIENTTLQHGGVTRYFDTYVPQGLPSSPVPLLLVLHGGTNSKEDVEVGPMSEFAGLADAEKFIIIIPNGVDPTTGLSGPTGQFNWNDCRNDAGVSETGADDVGFLGALIDWAEANFNIDQGRVYATGASNGGMMAYRLAFELSDRVAAVAALIANLPANSECIAEPLNPASVLIMNGTADPLMPYGGGQVAGNRGEVLSADATRDAWRSFLGTAPVPEHTVPPDLDPDDGGVVEIDLYSGGSAGKRVAFYRVNGAGHLPPSIAHVAPASLEQVLGKQNHDIEAADEIWAFFRDDAPAGGSSDVPALSGRGIVLTALLLAAALVIRALRRGKGAF
jgi:polyhydroxybutyrate depolymerase